MGTHTYAHTRAFTVMYAMRKKDVIKEIGTKVKEVIQHPTQLSFVGISGIFSL